MSSVISRPAKQGRAASFVRDLRSRAPFGRLARCAFSGHLDVARGGEVDAGLAGALLDPAAQRALRLGAQEALWIVRRTFTELSAIAELERHAETTPTLRKPKLI